MSIVRNHSEFCAAREWLYAETLRLKIERTQLKEQGLSADEIKGIQGPSLLEFAETANEVRDYEDAVLGNFTSVWNLDGVGRLMVRLRIAKGISVAELAERLGGVTAEELMREECFAYRNVTIKRAVEILDALDVQVVSNLDVLD